MKRIMNIVFGITCLSNAVEAASSVATQAWNDAKQKSAPAIYRYAKTIPAPYCPKKPNCSIADMTESVRIFETEDFVLGQVFFVTNDGYGISAINTAVIVLRRKNSEYSSPRKISWDSAAIAAVRQDGPSLSLISEFMKPGDARCCPTGRKTVRVNMN